MRRIEANEFSKRCRALLDGLDAEGIVITEQGRPVARLLPFHPPMADLIGSMRDKIRIRGDIVSTGAVWNAGS